MTNGDNLSERDVQLDRSLYPAGHRLLWTVATTTAVFVGCRHHRDGMGGLGNAVNLLFSFSLFLLDPSRAQQPGRSS